MTTFHRGRRLRATPELRTLVRETAPLLVEDLIMPYFVVETEDKGFRKEIGSMPGQFQLSLGELEKRVDSGEMAVAFAMYPTQLAELMAVADSGEVMPPKSTWFEPKLADGLASHVLD